MKMSGLVFVVVAMLTASVAHADCFDGFWMTIGCTLVGSTLAPTLSITGPGDDKDTYVQEVRDQAADFVANDGESVAGPMLRDAFEKMRATNLGSMNLSDQDLATLILKSD
jgi:uncharacterized protein (TIGR02448 family)